MSYVSDIAERPYPRPWQGRERQILLLLDALLKTSSTDLHSDKLTGLVQRCWFLRSFPSPDEFAADVHEITALIRKQVFGSRAVPNDPGERLRKICDVLGETVAAARQDEPPSW